MEENEFMIDGVNIPLPDADSYSIEKNDIDSSASGRTETGYMYREVVRTKVYKVSMQFHLTASECILLENLLSAVNFNLRFRDIGGYTEKTMYCSTLSTQCLSAADEELWLLSCNCQEV